MGDRIWRAALTLALACCGDKAGEATSAGTSSGSATTEAASEPTSSAPSTGGSTGAPICKFPPAEEFGPPVTVTVRNSGLTPIAISNCDDCDGAVLFGTVGGCVRLLGPDDQPVSVNRGSCDFRCSSVLTGKCGCGDGCNDSLGGIQLEPGASFVALWSGEHHVNVGADLPLACFGECGEFFPESLEKGCEVSQAAMPGRYRFVARALLEPGPGPDVAAEVSFDYPQMTAVEIVFP